MSDCIGAVRARVGQLAVELTDISRQKIWQANPEAGFQPRNMVTSPPQVKRRGRGAAGGREDPQSVAQELSDK